MSIRAVAAVLELGRDIKGSRRLVMIALADSMNDEGFAYPKRETIARKAALPTNKKGLDRVTQLLSSLEVDGYLVRHVNAWAGTLQNIPEGKRPNVYRFTDKVWQSAGVDEVAPQKLGTPPPQKLGSHGSPKNGDQNRHKEPSLEPKENVDDDIDPIDAPSPPTGVDPTPDDSDNTEPVKPKVDPFTDPDHEPYRNGARWVLDTWSTRTDAPRQKLTKTAINDMRLLMERGPTTWEHPKAIPKSEVAAVMQAAMDDKFWHKVIRSPGNLRDHWDELALLRRRTDPAATGPTAEETIRILTETYNTIGNREGWNAMLAALPDDRHRAIANAVGMRAFTGELVALQIAIRQQLKAAA